MNEKSKEVAQIIENSVLDFLQNLFDSNYKTRTINMSW